MTDGSGRVEPTSQARVRIDLDALAANWWLCSAVGGAPAGAAIKADGYGLGARAVADRLIAEGVRDLFVACWREAVQLGPLPPHVTLHVLHGVTADEAGVAAQHPATPVLNSPEQCALWRTIAPGRAADLMIDTGINRLGLAPSEVEAAGGLEVDMLMSHLACADERDHPMTAAQAAAFAAIDHPARRRSLLNSAGLFEAAASAFDLTRPGIALYGGTPHPAAAGRIGQVAFPQARVVQLRRLEPGDTVGYGATWAAARPSALAILATGYADGYRRALSNLGAAVVDGMRCPVVGRVSMDLIAVDVTDAPHVGPGDWIEVDYDLPRLAQAAGCSQYELLTGFGTRLDRVYTGARG